MQIILIRASIPMSEPISESTSPPPAAMRTEEQGSVLACDAERGHVIVSSQLLGGKPSVTIDHDGVNYILRATRAGKLILTK